MSLIAWYPLDGNAEDYSVNKNHGTPTNISWVNGKIGQAGSFDGLTSKISIPHSTLFKPQLPLSISLWYKPNVLSTSQALFSNDDYNCRGWASPSSGSNRYYGVFIDKGTSNNIAISFGNSGSCGGAGRRTAISSSPVFTSSSEWYHITGVIRSSNDFQIFINGVSVPITYSGTGTTLVYTNDMPATIGSAINNGLPTNGLINDVRIYDHALSQKEINDLAKAKVLHYTFNRDDALVMDASGYKRHGEKVGTITHDINNYLVNLDTSSYIQSPYKFNNDEFTIITKVRRDTISYWDVIWSSEIWGLNNGYLAYFNGTSGTVVFQNGGSTTGGPNVNASNFTNITEMNQYAFVKEKSGVCKIYINGILRDTKTLPNVAVERNLRFNSRYANNGDSGATDSRIKGFGESIVYAKALSDADILDLYQTSVKFDDAGNVYANEFVEDYEVADGLTLTQLFEDKNLLVNGDFKDGLNGWTIRGIAPVIVDGVLTYTNASSSSDIYRDGGLVRYKNYWIGYDYSLTQGRIFSRQGSASNANSIDVTTVGKGSFSKIYNATVTNSIFIIGSGQTGTTCTIDNIKIIRLTDEFAVEPTQAQMDAWYRDYSRVRPNAKGQMIARELNEVGIDTKFVELNNLSLREVFEDGNEIDKNYTGFNFLGISGTIIDGVVKFTADSFNDRFEKQVPYTINDKIFLAAYVKSTSNRIQLRGRDATYEVFHSGSGNFEYLTTISSALLTPEFPRVADLRTSNWTETIIDGMWYINLTALGINQTKEQMDTWYNRYRQFKLTTQQQRITKDTLVIKGEFKEV